jgi:hypothetical protein
MILIEFHLGLRQVFMALMNWAIDVPQKLLQSDARLFPKINDFIFIIKINILFCLLIKYIIERFIIHDLFYF